MEGHMLAVFGICVVLNSAICEGIGGLDANEAIKLPNQRCPAECLCSDDRKTISCRKLRLRDLEAICAWFPDLDELFVKESALGHARNTTLERCASLQVLDLARSGLKSLPYGSLNNAAGLRELNLQHNHIEIIGEADSYFDRMFGGRSVHVPTFLRCKNLHKIDLSGNDIKAISKESLYGMKYVRTLNLSSNSLRSTEHFFNYLMGIKILDVSFNRIKDVDARFGGMQLIMEEMYLSNNYISEMPQFESFQCDALVRVDLSYNELTSVRLAGVSDCRNLQRLELEGNRIKTLQVRELAKNIELKALNLARNSLDAIENGAFASCGNLEELHLNDNLLVDISEKTLQGLKKLTIFNAAYNRLSRINETVFSGSVWMGYIYLQHNQIEYVHPQAFSRLSLLVILNLSHNRLTSPYQQWFIVHSGEFVLDPDSHKVVEKTRGSLATFTLDGNSWACDCKSRNFYDWAQNQTLLDPKLLPKITCFSPRFHTGKLLSELDREDFSCDFFRNAVSYLQYYLSAFLFVIALCVFLYYFYTRRKFNAKHDFHVL